MTSANSKLVLGWLVVGLLTWSLAPGGLLSAACNSANCVNDKCYVHNRYCYKDGGADRGKTWAKAVVLQVGNTYYCTNKNTAGGTPAAKDKVTWKEFDNCDYDCPKDGLSTGSPIGNEVSSGTMDAIETECKIVPSGGEE